MILTFLSHLNCIWWVRNNTKVLILGHFRKQNWTIYFSVICECKVLNCFFVSCSAKQKGWTQCKQICQQLCFILLTLLLELLISNVCFLGRGQYWSFLFCFFFFCPFPKKIFLHFPTTQLSLQFRDKYIMRNMNDFWL